MRHLLLALCLALTVGSCSKAKPEAKSSAISADSSTKAYNVRLEWLKGPFALDYSTAWLVFTTPDGKEAASVKEIVFDPWMTSMGHGTHVDEQTITLFDGTTNSFTVDNVFFNMGGLWDINVTATVNGITDTAVIPVVVP